MKTKFFFAKLLAVFVLSTLVHAEVVVTGPPGLDANSFVGTLPVAPLTPLFEQMPLKNRLDVGIQFTNKTAGFATYSGGSVNFRSASGALLHSAALSPAEYVARATISPVVGFVNGLVHISFANHTNATLTGLARSPLDGRIVAGGWGIRSSDSQRQFLIARVLADGTLDPAFAGNGLKGGTLGTANAVAMQNDGKIVLAGFSGTDIVMQRLNFDGSEDETFGPNGTRPTFFGSPTEALAVAVDGNGRIVVAGRTQVAGAWQIVLVRYLPTGPRDFSFDGDGIAITDIAAADIEGAAGLTIDASNRPVIAGWAGSGGSFRMIVARYRANDGGLDTTFSGDGIVFTSFTGAASVEGRSVAIDGAGRIVVGGMAYVDGEQRFAVARFTTAGAFDVTFSANGQDIPDFGGTSSESASAITLFGNEVYSAGRGVDVETDYFNVARHDANGVLNPQFSNDGKQYIRLVADDETATFSAASGIVTIPLGDIVVGGTATIADARRWVLARYNPDGTPDFTPTIPPGATVTLNFADFPYFTDIDTQTFDGFSPKATPVRMDVELNFAGFTQPFSITGIELRTFTQNAKAYRFPLHDPVVAGAKWVVGGGHENGTPHSNIPSQRFHWDVSASLNGSSVIPGVDPADFQEYWEGHASGNYDPNKNYAAAELPNCRIAWGEPVYAMASGTVVRSANDKEDNFPVGDKTFGTGAGNSAVIDHGNGEFGVYAHMKKGSVTVTAGQFVAAGMQIGVVGNSGSSSGPHIHFGLLDDPGVDSWSNSQSRPMYFIDAKFPTASGGLAVRQLRAAPRDGEAITIDPSTIPIASPGVVYGPSLVNEILTPHDSVITPQRLATPVTVQGNIGSTPGTAMADGGDVIEDVYRFNVNEKATVWVRLEFNAGHDLDVVLYDGGLKAISPESGKTLARPETFYAVVPTGVYYLGVSRYDPSGNAPVNYTLHVGVYPNGRDIYVDRYSLCAIPFGNLACGGGWGGPFPTIKQGHEVAFPGSRMFIHTGIYQEAITLRNPVVIRSYGGAATINP